MAERPRASTHFASRGNCDQPVARLESENREKPERRGNRSKEGCDSQLLESGTDRLERLKVTPNIYYRKNSYVQRWEVLRVAGHI